MRWSIRWMRWTLVLGLGASPALASPPAPPSVPGSSKPAPAAADTFLYKGKLLDDAGKPVSGIFPLTFRLHPSLKARNALWTETLWVAVDRGVYTVALGASKPLPRRDDLDKLVLSVSVRGGPELLREPFLPVEARPPVLTAGPAGASHGGPGGRAGSGVRYAETAAYAVEADHAKNADRIQNLTLEDLVRRLAEEIGNALGQGAGGKVRIGTTKRLGNRVGGPGGTGEYNEGCPKGHVMTGIRGASGNFIDSIQIICSPLE